jgi:hypothetical protein
MSIIENSRIYYINGGEREDGTSSQFSHQFIIPEHEQYDRCVVLQASIPLSYYLIQNNFNIFKLQEGGSIVNIVIPAGNYSANSLILVLAPILNTASPNGYVYSITLPNQYITASTAKYTFSVSGNGANQPVFIFGDHMTEVFGFTLNSSNSFSSNILVSNVLNFIPESGIYIHSDMVKGESDILQEIYSNNTVNFSMITWVCPNIEAYSKVLLINKGNIFKFSLTNELNQVLDLNNQNILLTIMLYKKNNIDVIFKKFLEYSINNK